MRTFTDYSSSDHNGFRPNGAAENSFEWDSPPTTIRQFATLADYSVATRQDVHSVLVDFDVFVNVGIPDRADPQRLYNPEELDFRLRAGSAAIDAGVELPSITDGFTGVAPDLGAYEFGKAGMPTYGPRGPVSGSAPADAPRSARGPP